MKAKCEECGEWMPNAFPTPGGHFVCTTCYGDELPLSGYDRDHGAVTDMRYHGERFHDGEW